jgi:diguanylate cyclase (GGDEF)-like protein
MSERHDEDEGIIDPGRLHALLPYLRETVYLFDLDGNLTARLGPPGGILGHALQPGESVFSHIHPDDVPRGLEVGADLQASQIGWVGEYSIRLRHADGTWRQVEVRIHNHRDDPELAGMVAVLREVLPAPERPLDPLLEGRGPAASALGELGAIANGLPTAYLVLGPGGRVRHVSDAAAELLGCGRDELLALPIDELAIDLDRPQVRAAYDTLARTTGSRTVVCTTRARFANRVVEAEFHTRGTDHGRNLVTVVLVDHTAEPELVRLATRDALTGLANRTKVLETIAGLLLDPEPVLSVVYVDLDDLKAINDTHGHETGDRALIEVAQHLRGLVRPADLVGRMSGDEFVVVCPELGGRSLMAMVERIATLNDGSCQIATPDGRGAVLTVSAGGATASAGDTTASLLSRADEAMFAAKHARP